MEEILNAFGIDLKLIIVQMLNFGVLLFALWYFLYTPILRLLSDRQEKIRKGVEDANTAAESLKNAEKITGEMLAAAHTEAGHIVKRAEEHANQKVDEIFAESHKKAEAIVAHAEKVGEDIKEKSKKDAEAEIAKAAILAAEKILAERS